MDMWSWLILLSGLEVGLRFIQQESSAGLGADICFWIFIDGGCSGDILWARLSNDILK